MMTLKRISAYALFSLALGLTDLEELLGVPVLFFIKRLVQDRENYPTSRLTCNLIKSGNFKSKLGDFTLIS